MKATKQGTHVKTRNGVVEETTFADEVINSLNDFFETVQRGERVTVRDVSLDLRPHEYTAEDVKTARINLCVSQAVFAKLLAVQVKTVQSWEQGERPAPGPVCRLLDEMNQDPNRWLKMLKESVKSKAVSR